MYVLLCFFEKKNITTFRCIKIIDNDARRRHKDTDIEQHEITESNYELTGLQDPMSAKAVIKHDLSLTYGATSNQPIATKVLTNSQMTCDLDNFYLTEHIKVLLNNEVVYENTWESNIPRIFG